MKELELTLISLTSKSSEVMVEGNVGTMFGGDAVRTRHQRIREVFIFCGVRLNDRQAWHRRYIPDESTINGCPHHDVSVDSKPSTHRAHQGTRAVSTDRDDPTPFALEWPRCPACLGWRAGGALKKGCYVSSKLAGSTCKGKSSKDNISIAVCENAHLDIKAGAKADRNISSQKFSTRNKRSYHRRTIFESD